MSIKGIALENVRDGPMEHAGLGDLHDAPGHFVSRIELQQRFGPELPLRKSRINCVADLRVRDIDEAPDVAGVVIDDSVMRFENVHTKTPMANDRRVTFPATGCRVVQLNSWPQIEVSAILTPQTSIMILLLTTNLLPAPRSLQMLNLPTPRFQVLSNVSSMAFRNAFLRAEQAYWPRQVFKSRYEQIARFLEQLPISVAPILIIKE